MASQSVAKMPMFHRAHCDDRLRTSCPIDVSCFQSEVPEDWKRSDQLQNIYNNFLAVTAKLKAYQYPRDRASFDRALANTFSQLGISDDPEQVQHCD